MSSEETSTQQGIVKLLYLEILRKDEYKQWLEDPCYVGEALAKQRKPGDIPSEFQRRFDISHLNHNLAAWQARLPHLNPPFYSFADVSGMVEQSPSRVFEYFLDELKWECEYSVKVRQSTNGNTHKTLVIYLPNDGYFYINGVQMEEFFGNTKKANLPNNRHRKTCHQGWSLLDKNVWQKKSVLSSRSWFLGLVKTTPGREWRRPFCTMPMRTGSTFAFGTWIAMSASNFRLSTVTHSRLMMTGGINSEQKSAKKGL